MKALDPWWPHRFEGKGGFTLIPRNPSVCFDEIDEKSFLRLVQDRS